MARWTHARPLLIVAALFAALVGARAEPQLPSPPLGRLDVRGDAYIAGCYGWARGRGGVAEQGSAPLECRDIGAPDLPWLSPLAKSTDAGLLTGILAVDRLAAGSITAAKLATGAAIANIGYTPLAPNGSGAGLTGITASQIGGLAASATVDTTDASKITSGLLPISRIGDGSVTSAKLATGAAIANLGFTPLAPTGSGAGLTGITPAQIGLGAVNNTSDAAKPVSTLQAAAISAVSGKLPTTIYSTAAGVPSSLPPFALSFVEWGGKQKVLMLNSPSYGQVVIEAPAVRGADANGLLVMGPPYMIAGLDLQYLNDTQLVLQPGTWVAGVPYRTFAFDANMFVSTTTVGLNGTDADYSSAPDGHYYVYILGKETQPWNDTKVVLSKKITIQEMRDNLNANVPSWSAYSHIRKLPAAVRVEAGKLLPYTTVGGWPYPIYRYTGADTSSAKWALFQDVTSTTEVTASVASRVPDNGRRIGVTLVVKSGGTAGYGCLRTPGVPGEGQCVWVPDTSGDIRSRRVYVQTNSARELYYKTPAGATMSAYIDEVDMGEQS